MAQSARYPTHTFLLSASQVLDKQISIRKRSSSGIIPGWGAALRAACRFLSLRLCEGAGAGAHLPAVAPVHPSLKHPCWVPKHRTGAVFSGRRAALRKEMVKASCFPAACAAPAPGAGRRQPRRTARASHDKTAEPSPRSPRMPGGDGQKRANTAKNEWGQRRRLGERLGP